MCASGPDAERDLRGSMTASGTRRFTRPSRASIPAKAVARHFPEWTPLTVTCARRVDLGVASARSPANHRGGPDRRLHRDRGQRRAQPGPPCLLLARRCPYLLWLAPGATGKMTQRMATSDVRRHPIDDPRFLDSFSFLSLAWFPEPSLSPPIAILLRIHSPYSIQLHFFPFLLSPRLSSLPLIITLFFPERATATRQGFPWRKPLSLQ